MALGGVFGVMNTMFAAIRQRTTDIAMLRLLGFARRSAPSRNDPAAQLP